MTLSKLKDLKVRRRSPDLFNNVKIGQGQLQLIMKHILFYQPFWSSDLSNLMNNPSVISVNKKRYDSELPYQRPDLIEVMEIEIDLTTSTNVHTSFYISVRECLD